MKTRTQQTLDLLRAYESSNVTFIEQDSSWPVVWHRARGVHVWDADGKKYLDLTAAFGVAAAGHANPRVVRAGQRQMAALLHAMGDVHPHELKAKLARELSRITFERWSDERFEVQKSEFPGPKLGGKFEIGRRARSAQAGKTIFCNSGFEAVEAALKTAMLATGRRGVIAFEGAYHGLGYGALNATHREHFRSPFHAQLGNFAVFAPFPLALTPAAPQTAIRKSRMQKRLAAPMATRQVEGHVLRLLARHEIGAILVEPIQGRGGINVPPPDFLPMLRRVCDEHGALLVLDEIFTGFGRTGRWFACEHNSVAPDVICLGKGMAGGFPLSACVGRADVMDRAWPLSSGEAIHTSTFLGHPVGCAMALANMTEIRRTKLVERSAHLGKFLLEALGSRIQNDSRISLRGLGLMAGLELREADGIPATEWSLRIIKAMLSRGFILLPEGEHSNVIGFTPPLTISERQISTMAMALADALGKRMVASRSTRARRRQRSRFSE